MSLNYVMLGSNDVVRAISDSQPYQFDFALWQGVVIAAALSGVISLISWAQNALEDKSGKTALK